MRHFCRRSHRPRLKVLLLSSLLVSGAQGYCRYTSRQTCSGTEHYLHPYSVPAGLSTFTAPIDVHVPAPITVRDPDSFFVSYNVVDLDSDTWPDIVVVHSNHTIGSGSSVMWLRNTGPPPPGTPHGKRLLPGYVWIGSVLDVHGLVMAMAVADLNGDGVADIVLGFEGFIRMYWGAKGAQRTVYDSARYQEFPFDLGPVAPENEVYRVATKWPMMQVADLNGDGLNDLIVRRSSDANWAVFDDENCDLELLCLQNTGNSTSPAFSGEPVDHNPFENEAVCESFFLFDLDNDGDLDWGYLRLLPRQHHWEFRWSYLENIGSSKEPRFIQSGHNNPLKVLYLQVANDQKHWGTRQVLWAPRRTTDGLHHMLRPSFEVFVEMSINFVENGVHNGEDVVPYMPSELNRDPFEHVPPDAIGEQLIFVDMNFNGTLDAVGSGTSILLNTGNVFSPNFEVKPVVGYDFASSISGLFTKYWAVALEDLTGDGARDLLAMGDDNQLYMWPNLNAPMSWSFAEEPTTFNVTAGFAPPINTGDCHTRDRMLFADLDGDGKMDLTVVSCRVRRVTGLRVWKNVGTGTAPSFVGEGAELYDWPYFYMVAAAIDVDADGKSELVLAGNLQPYFKVFSVSFDPEGYAMFYNVSAKNPFEDLFLPTNTPRQLYSADLDADGILDVVMDTGTRMLTFQGGKCGFSSAACSSNGACLSSQMSYGTCLCSTAYDGTHCDECAAGHTQVESTNGHMSCVSCASQGWGEHSSTNNGACVCREGFGVNATLQGGNTSHPAECSCPPGQYYRPKVCQECPINTYKEHYSLDTTCKGCPTRDYITLSTGSNNASSCVCPMGFYDTNFTACVACGEGLDCAQPGMKLRALVLMNGYWRASVFSEEVRKCPDNAGCQGGSEIERQCERGSEGPLCSLCSPGYSRSWTSPCRPCRSIGVIVSVPLVLLLVVAGFCYWASRMGRLPRLHLSRRVKIVVTLFQVIGTFNETFDTISASQLLGKVANSPIVKLLRVDLGGLFALRCMNHSLTYFELLLIYTIAPIVFILLMVCGMHLWNRLRHLHSHLRLEVTEATFLISNLAYMGVSERILGVFNPCDKFADGRSYFPLDYRISCGSPKYTVLLTYAIGMTIIYPFGVPATYLYLLYTRRDRIKRRPTDLDGFTDPSIKFMSSIFESYKGKYWFYEVVDVGTRMTYVLLASTLADNKASQLLWSMVLSLASGTLLYQLRPYKDNNEQHLAEIAFWQLHLTFISTLVPLVYPNMSPHASRALSVAVLVLNTSTVAMAALQTCVKARQTVAEPLSSVFTTTQGGGSGGSFLMKFPSFFLRKSRSGESGTGGLEAKQESTLTDNTQQGSSMRALQAPTKRLTSLMRTRRRPSQAAPTGAMGEERKDADTQGQDVVAPTPGSPQAVGPSVSGPHAVGPRISSPQAIGPRVSSPQAIGARVSSPHAVGPRVSSPQAIGARGSSPQGVGARGSSPQATGARVSSPRVHGEVGVSSAQAHDSGTGSPPVSSPHVHSASCGSTPQASTAAGPSSPQAHDVDTTCASQEAEV